MELSRMEEGRQLLTDHLTRVREAATLFVAALRGFRRDAALSVQSCGEYIDMQFEALPHGLSVPMMQDGGGFMLLEKILSEAESVLDGEIILSKPKKEDADMLDKETDMMHENLLSVAEMGQQLHDVVQDALLAFDMFNAENLSKKTEDANIIFGRDATSVSMATARALAERAVRLDIDLVAQKHKIEFPDHPKGK